MESSTGGCAISCALAALVVARSKSPANKGSKVLNLIFASNMITD
jgi:hypothetical protein